MASGVCRSATGGIFHQPLPISVGSIASSAAWYERSHRPTAQPVSVAVALEVTWVHWIAQVAALDVSTVENSRKTYRSVPLRSSSAIDIVCSPVRPFIESVTRQANSAGAQPPGARDRAVHDILNPGMLIAT